MSIVRPKSGDSTNDVMLASINPTRSLIIDHAGRAINKAALPKLRQKPVLNSLDQLCPMWGTRFIISQT